MGKLIIFSAPSGTGKSTIVRYLVDKDFTLLISLDGDEEEQGYRIDHAGNNSFQRAFNNIMLLKEKYPSFWENNINFNAVLHNRNGVERVYKFYKEHIGKMPMISPINKFILSSSLNFLYKIKSISFLRRIFSSSFSFKSFIAFVYMFSKIFRCCLSISLRIYGKGPLCLLRLSLELVR